jgi:hypothetical protein
MPISAILLSILGLAPYIGCGLGALGAHAASADRMLIALIAWGALVLAFTGGLHWGLVLREAGAGPATAADRPPHARIAMAVLPLVLGWVAVLLPVIAASWLGLVLLIAAYLATLAAEHRWSRTYGWPTRYLWLRWGFTIVAVAMLITVMTLRLLGQTIVL